MAYPTSVNNQITDAVQSNTTPLSNDVLATMYHVLERQVDALHHSAVAARHLLDDLRAALSAAGVPVDPSAKDASAEAASVVPRAQNVEDAQAPAIAMGNLFLATSQALANAAHNATTAQQQASVTAQAATTMGVSTLYSVDTASTGKATTQIFG